MDDFRDSLPKSLRTLPIVLEMNQAEYKAFVEQGIIPARLEHLRPAGMPKGNNA